MKKELREGYKMTELGEIPNEWNIIKLRDVVTYHNAGIYKKKELFGEGTNIVGVSNLYNNNSIDGQIFKKVPLTEDELKEYTLQEGDLIYGDSSLVREGIGRTLYVTKKGEGTAFAWHTRRFKVNKTLIDSRFLNYILNYNKSIRKQIISLSTQTALTGITTDDFFSINILVPSLKEQKNIGNIISIVDEQIENTEKLIQKNQELKKGLMQQLLTKGIGHTEFKKTELGEIPKEWEIKLLEDLSIKIGDGLHGTPVYNKKGKYYFINGNNLNEGKIVLTNETKMIDKLEYEKYKKELNENTILLSLNGTIGNLSFYNYENIVLGKSVGYINLNDDIDKIYIFYALSSEDIKKYFYKELTGTTIKNLSLNTLRRTKIKVPTILEQEKIALILSSIDEKIEKIKEKKENLNKIKKGLMQQLLNGKIRVE